MKNALNALLGEEYDKLVARLRAALEARYGPYYVSTETVNVKVANATAEWLYLEGEAWFVRRWSRNSTASKRGIRFSVNEGVLSLGLEL